MKTKTHVGNVTLILDRPIWQRTTRVLLGLKRKKRKGDEKRTRKVVGSGKFVPPGGATEPTDKSQKHSAQREVLQETGIFIPLRCFRKVGILRGYINDNPTPLWLVHIYLANIGRIDKIFAPNEEYEKMCWFFAHSLPHDQMLSSDKYWMYRLLTGEKLSIRIRYKDNTDKETSVYIRPISSFN